MDQPKHTRGPWGWQPFASPDGPNYDTEPDQFSVYQEDGETIAYMNYETNGAEQSEADARLIAAAPDLLAACKEVLCALPERSPMRPIVRAAIAKAEGREGSE